MKISRFYHLLLRSLSLVAVATVILAAEPHSGTADPTPNTVIIFGRTIHLLDEFTARTILQVVYVLIGAVLLLVPDILYGTKVLDVPFVRRFLTECTGTAMLATGLYSILAEMSSSKGSDDTNDGAAISISTNAFENYGYAAMIFLPVYVKWWWQGMYPKAGIDVSMFYFTFVLSLGAVYAGFVLHSKEVIRAVILFFVVNAIMCIAKPKLVGKLWGLGNSDDNNDNNDTNKPILDDLTLHLCRSNGFFTLCMETQFYFGVVLADENDNNNNISASKILAYSSLHCLVYLVSTFFYKTKDAPRLGLQHAGHVAAISLFALCIVSILFQ